MVLANSKAGGGDAALGGVQLRTKWTMQPAAMGFQPSLPAALAGIGGLSIWSLSAYSFGCGFGTYIGNSTASDASAAGEAPAETGSTLTKTKARIAAKTSTLATISISFH